MSDNLNPFDIDQLYMLFLLKTVNFPINKNEIVHIILTLGIMDYFSLNKNLDELLEKNLAKKTETESERYVITESGIKVLDGLEHMISQKITKELSDYLAENRKRIAYEQDIKSQYTKKSTGAYDAYFEILDRGNTVFSMHITLPTEELAKRMCKNWIKVYSTVYSGTTNALCTNDL